MSKILAMTVQVGCICSSALSCLECDLRLLSLLKPGILNNLQVCVYSLVNKNHCVFITLQ